MACPKNYEMRSISEDDTFVAVRYLDIDSTYRDRALYPLQGEFVALASDTGVSGAKTALTSRDPVTRSYPIATFQGNSLPIIGTITGGTAGAPKLQPVSFFSSDPTVYKGAAITNTTTGETSRISSFIVQDDQAILVFPFSAVAPGDGFQISDPSTRDAVFLANLQTQVNPTNLVGYYLVDETTGESRQITAYSALTNSIVLDTPFTAAWSVNDTYAIVESLSTVQSGTATAMTATTITLDPGLTPSTVVGQFLDIRAPGPLYHTSRIITAYDPGTGVATVNSPFTTLVAVPGAYAILPFSYDSSSSLGSGTGTIESGLYTVNLLTLILPNVEIAATPSKRLSSFPYLYVELGNMSERATPGQLITNNPYGRRALFKTPVFDTSNVLASDFIKLNGSGISQLIQFNPSEDVYVRVLLPGGSVFATSVPDFSPPAPPNSSLQISLTFSLSRVTSLSSKTRSFPLVR